MDKNAKSFFEEYLKSLPSSQRETMMQRPLSVDYFCNNPYDANLCASLVLQRKKTATSSLKIAYKIENEPLPQMGNLQIITDWDKRPVCLIEIIDIQEIPFYQISESFARLEGEGDLSLDFWRKSHKTFFTEECKAYGIPFREDMIIICEIFKNIFDIQESQHV